MSWINIFEKMHEFYITKLPASIQDFESNNTRSVLELIFLNCLPSLYIANPIAAKITIS